MTLCFHALFMYTHVYNKISALEFGDPNKEHWIHAIFFVTLNLLDEPFLLRIWNVGARSFHLCKQIVLSFQVLLPHQTAYLKFVWWTFFIFPYHVQVPNGMGTILGAVQLALYAYYSRRHGEGLGSRQPFIESCAWFNTTGYGELHFISLHGDLAIRISVLSRKWVIYVQCHPNDSVHSVPFLEPHCWLSLCSG